MWGLSDRRQARERSKHLVLSGFDDKKRLEILAWELYRNKSGCASDNGVWILSSQEKYRKKRGWEEKGRGGGEKRVMPALRFTPSITYQVADSSPASSDTGSRKHYLTLQSCLGCHLQGT